MSPIHSAPPIIVAGTHRSGSSLLRRLLNGQPTIFCPPEIKFHKDLLGQHPDDPLAHGRLGASIASLGLPEDEWLDLFGAALVECYRRATLRAGKQRWADKNPENCLNIPHWHRLLQGQLRFVLVLRNPLDVLVSMREAAMHRVYPADAAGRVEHVRRHLEAALDYIDRFPTHCRIVHYESLVLDAAAEVGSLCAWLGEPVDPGAITRIDDVSHGMGLEDPKIRQHPRVHAASVDRWVESLSSEEVAMTQHALAACHARARRCTPADWRWTGFDANRT